MKFRNLHFKGKELFIFIFLTVLFINANISCAGKNNKKVPIAENNEIVNGIIPMSLTMTPEDMNHKAQRKKEHILSFFKTPEQQLMPLGFYAMVEDMRNVEVLKRLRRNHINLVHKYKSHATPEGAKKDLDAARKAGIGVLQNLPRAHLLKRDMDWWRRYIRTLAENKQILVWYLTEERKDSEEIKRNMAIADSIREIDDHNRPLFTYVAKPEKTHLKKSGDYVDALIFGAYPSYYSPRPRIDIRRRIDLAYSSGVPVVIGAVEAVKDPDPGKRLPAMGATRPEYIRADAYIALISGAQGLMWYCWAQAREVPGLKEAIYKVTKELNGPQRIGEVFLCGKPVDDITCKLISGEKYAPPASAYENQTTNKVFLYSSLQWTARKHLGYLYIFAVNVNEKIRAPDNGGDAYSLDIQFHIPYQTGGKIEVLLEERNINLNNGKFNDKFLPLDVNVYKIGLD